MREPQHDSHGDLCAAMPVMLYLPELLPQRQYLAACGVHVHCTTCKALHHSKRTKTCTCNLRGKKTTPCTKLNTSLNLLSDCSEQRDTQRGAVKGG
eukprot:3661234-Amphidinium_carterae.1